MLKKNFLDYLDQLKYFTDKEYLYYTIAYNAAPTLAQNKPSSLLIFKNSNRKLNNSWIECKKEIKSNFNIEYFELNCIENSTAVLFYNKRMLERILQEKQSINFLRRFGYNAEMNTNQYLEHLSNRYNKICPHEIGIFLGYPVADVAVFTNCPNKKCLAVGYWKVYFNIDNAKRIFNKYDVAKNNVIDLMIDGVEPKDIIEKKMLISV
ncbi:DUF3793 family protein [Clostridium sediminicola]|uniref:DUF3793 family protein n=1 Tax=Clostridium sediminicola TaxID=3114879 RepID=UPI0031F261D0